MVDDRDPDDLMMDINTEISHRVAASMRLKLGLLSWFCHNMRRRCVMEVVARQGLFSPVTFLIPKYMIKESVYLLYTGV